MATYPRSAAPLAKRRCIVPSNGFYEWRRTGGPKQPYFLHPPERAVLAMAGIWAVWKDPETGLWVPSAAVITTEANRMMSSIHDRMPVLLPRETWDDWLDPGMDDPDYLSHSSSRRPTTSWACIPYHPSQQRPQRGPGAAGADRGERDAQPLMSGRHS